MLWVFLRVLNALLLLQGTDSYASEDDPNWGLEKDACLLDALVLSCVEDSWQLDDENDALAIDVTLDHYCIDEPPWPPGDDYFGENLWLSGGDDLGENQSESGDDDLGENQPVSDEDSLGEHQHSPAGIDLGNNPWVEDSFDDNTTFRLVHPTLNGMWYSISLNH